MPNDELIGEYNYTNARWSHLALIGVACFCLLSGYLYGSRA